MGQEMKYAVGLWEKERGDLIYNETKDSQYSGEVVMYTGSLSPLPDDKTYTALVVLETGGQNLTSLPLTLPLIQDSKLMLTILRAGVIINPRRACAARVTVCVCPRPSSATKRQTRHTGGLSIVLASV